MKKIVVFLFLASLVYAQEKPYRILNSFNSGELSSLLSAREDLSKFQSGCSLLENFIVLPQGGVTKRPGTVYVAESKSSTKIRLIPFEYSTTQSYIIELGNQYARFYTNNDRISEGEGTEDLSALDNLTAHWKLNDNAVNTDVIDADGATYNGTASANTETLTITGNVNTCFDLDATASVEIADAAAFTFSDSNANDTAFSVACWAFVTETSDIQVLLSKWLDSGTSREWRFGLDSNRKLQLLLCDTSSNLTANLIAHWYLNDSAANTAVDDAEAGDEHDGVASSNTNTIDAIGKIGSCFDFASTETVYIADNAELSFDDSADKPFSIAAWIYVEDSDGSQHILTKYKTPTDREWTFEIDLSEKLSMVLVDESDDIHIRNDADAGLSTGWHFVCGVYDNADVTWTKETAASYITLYVDGSAVASTATNNANYDKMDAGATNVVIGGYYAAATITNSFDNKIDNTALFSKAISASEVSSLWNSGDGTEGVVGVTIGAVSDAVVDLGWHFLAVTYSAPSDETAAADGIILYVDGSAVDLTATNDATYTAMQGGAEEIRIGAQQNTGDTATEKIWGDKIDNMAVFADVLSSTEITALYTASVYEIATPYLTADLFELKMEQSADTLYITHLDYETRKLQRYSDAWWALTVLSFNDGPFIGQNTTVAGTIAASATTGLVTLAASGCTPFAEGTTAGHEPSGSAATDKSQTGALFRLIHPLGTLAYQETLEDNYTNSQVEDASWTALGTLYKGTGWTLVTTGTWTGTLEIQRNYTVGAAHGANGWEKVLQYISADDRNVSTTGTEDLASASYRAILIASGDAAEACQVDFFIDEIEHVGIVEIVSVESPTSSTATVLTTLGSTDATHQWSEGSCSNYRGWFRTVAFFEDRLMFGGNASQPDTIWGSVTGDYDSMLEGANDDDAVIFTLTSRQVNVIQWLISKTKLLIGTSGAEWTLAGSADEPLSPSNVTAAQQSTYGSANLQANLASESVLFIQRNEKKMREMAYNWELDSYVSPDMMILNPSISGDGIANTAYQQTPDSVLWCVRDDGEMPIFSYERKEAITAWSRLITDGEFESVAVISGTNEAQVWVSVKRTIGSNDKRYIEYFKDRDFGTDVNDAYFVDCGITYDSTATTTITGLGHLEAETVYVLGDGAVQDSQTVSGGQISIDSASTVQVGLPFTAQLKTMPLSYMATQTIHGRIKRVNEVIVDFYRSGDFYIGRDTTDKELVSIDGMENSEDVDNDENRITFPLGYDRLGKILVYQQSPEPLTLVAIMVEFLSY